MDPDLPAALCQIERDGPAEAKGRAGDKRDRRVLLFGHICVGRAGLAVAIRGRLYFRDAFGEPTNLTAPKQFSSQGHRSRRPFFRTGPMSYRFTMADKQEESRGAAPDATTVAAATPSTRPSCSPFTTGSFTVSPIASPGTVQLSASSASTVTISRPATSRPVWVPASSSTGQSGAIRRTHAARHQPPLPGAVRGTAGAIPPASLRNKSAGANCQRA